MFIELLWGLEQHLNKPCQALLAVAEIPWLPLLVWPHPLRLMPLLCCNALLDTKEASPKMWAWLLPQKCSKASNPHRRGPSMVPFVLAPPTHSPAWCMAPWQGAEHSYPARICFSFCLQSHAARQTLLVTQVLGGAERLSAAARFEDAHPDVTQEPGVKVCSQWGGGRC